MMTEAHLNADSFNDAGNNVKNLHFGVTLIDLLQQLEQQAKNRLQVLKRNKISVNEQINKSNVMTSNVQNNHLTGKNCSVLNSKSSTGEAELSVMTAGEKQWILKHTSDYQTCRWMRMRVIKVIIRRHANKRVMLNDYGLIGKLITSVLKCIQLKLTNDHSGVKTGNYNRLSITQRKGYPALELWLFRCEPKREKNALLFKNL